MKFVDTNVFMYAVGRPHPLRDEARTLLRDHLERGEALATSAEVLQELLHAYVPVDRIATLDAALKLADDLAVVWPIEAADVADARLLHARHPGLSARDLLHLAVCLRREVNDVLTFDRALAAAFGR